MTAEASPKLRFVRGQPPRKAIARLIVGLVILSTGTAMMADVVGPGIVDRYPAALIAMNPRNRNLILVTNQLDAITFYAVGFIRNVSSDPLYFLLGFWYGEKAIAWVERRSRTYGPLVRDGESYFRRLAYPLIFFMPNTIISALSGATGIRIRTFVALNVTGTMLRLYLIRRVGEAFESPIQRLLDLIAQYRIPLLVISALAVAWTVFGEFRGGNSELQTLTELTDEPDQDGDQRDDQDADQDS